TTRSELAVSKDDLPDLFLFVLPGNSGGYKKGYSKGTQNEEEPGKENHRRFTWVILKAITRNYGKNAGSVTLRSNHPLHRPVINFNYFDNNKENKGWEEDLAALVEGVRFVSQVLVRESGLRPTVIWPEAGDLRGNAELEKFIKRESWGHHACGTCKIGKDGDRMAVLDGDFRVRGVKNLRVVDASVFPRIPGFFIVTSIYMISEK